MSTSVREINIVPFPPTIEDYSGAMDLFGDIDDISSESDGDNQPPIPGKPVVSTVTNHNWPHCSKLRKKFQRLMGLTCSCRERTWIMSCLKHLMNSDFLGYVEY